MTDPSFERGAQKARSFSPSRGTEKIGTAKTQNGRMNVRARQGHCAQHGRSPSLADAAIPPRWPCDGEANEFTVTSIAGCPVPSQMLQSQLREMITRARPVRATVKTGRSAWVYQRYLDADNLPSVVLPALADFMPAPPRSASTFSMLSCRHLETTPGLRGVRSTCQGLTIPQYPVSEISGAARRVTSPGPDSKCRCTRMKWPRLVVSHCSVTAIPSRREKIFEPTTHGPTFQHLISLQPSGNHAPSTIGEHQPQDGAFDNGWARAITDGAALDTVLNDVQVKLGSRTNARTTPGRERYRPSRGRVGHRIRGASNTLGVSLQWPQCDAEGPVARV